MTDPTDDAPSFGIERGSGNVFADIGVPDAEWYLVKADLAIRIDAVIDERGLTQAQAAAIAGVDQPKLSRIRNGKLGGFSVDRLCRVLNRLGVSVAVVTRKEPGWKEAGTRVVDLSEDGAS